MDSDYASNVAMPGLGSVGGRVSAAANQIEPEISAAASEAQHLGKILAELRSNVSAFIERALVGDAPQPTGSVQGQDKVRRSLNGGSTGQLRREIELATEIAEDALRLSNRLRQIG